jgi:hypothetical protein
MNGAFFFQRDEPESESELHRLHLLCIAFPSGNILFRLGGATSKELPARTWDQDTFVPRPKGIARKWDQADRVWDLRATRSVSRGFALCFQTDSDVFDIYRANEFDSPK